jgi:protein-disulfide isomerase
MKASLLALLLLALAEPGHARAAPPALQDAAVAPLPVPRRVLGQADAPVRIDVYMSFVCVDCAQWWQTVLPQLMDRYIRSGQVRLVFHDVAIEPIQHSVRASMIGLCAAPDKFFDVADSFMGGLAAAAEDAAAIPAWYDAAIAASGVPAEEMQTCLGNEAVYEQVRQQSSSPGAAAFDSFPGVMVKRQPLPDASWESIMAAITEVSATPQAN